MKKETKSSKLQYLVTLYNWKLKLLRDVLNNKVENLSLVSQNEITCVLKCINEFFPTWAQQSRLFFVFLRLIVEYVLAVENISNILKQKLFHVVKQATPTFL